MEQSRYDGCLFYRLDPRREEKVGRHIDDLLVTGPEPNLERFLAQARDKLSMQDAVRVYKANDEGRLVISTIGTWVFVARRTSSHSRNCHNAEVELYGIGLEHSKVWGTAQLLQEWQCKRAPMPLTNSQSALALCEQRGPGRMKHFEMKMFTVQEMAESGTTSCPHMSTHDNPADFMTKAMTREKLIKFWTCSEIARIILRRLEPTCTVTSVTPITKALTILMNTVTSFQNRRLTAHGRNLRTTIETGIDDSPQLSTSNSINEFAKYRPSSKLQMCLCATIRTMLRRRMAIKNDVAQVRAVRSLTLANDIAASDAKLAVASARKRLQTTASLKPSRVGGRCRL